MADQVNHGLIVLDSEERIVLWNQWVSQRSKIDASTALGSELAEVFPEGLDPRMQRATRAAIGSGTSSIVAAGGGRHCLVEINDVTPSQSRERLLREQAREVQRQNEELGRSNEQLDEFAHIVSHDLKEPLRGIRMFSTFLLEDYGSKLDEEGRSRLSRLIGLSERMHKPDRLDSALLQGRADRAGLRRRLDSNSR